MNDRMLEYVHCSTAFSSSSVAAYTQVVLWPLKSPIIKWERFLISSACSTNRLFGGVPLHVDQTSQQFIISLSTNMMLTFRSV